MNPFREKLNLTHFIITALIFVAFFTSVDLVLAVPAAPSPTCEIEADVLSVEKTKTTIPPPLFNAPSRKIVEYYSINLKILKVSTFLDEGFKTCDDLYPVNSERETILFPDEYNKSPFTNGQRIKGKLHLDGDERFGGFFLSDISVLAQPPQQAKTIITGSVISGGDTTPEGLFDVPRKFVYEVRQADGSIVKVVYIAYPPSPVGDREMKKIRLSFYAGTVQVGDQLKARGSFDKTSQTLTVADKGDYIETWPKQESIIGKQDQKQSEKQLPTNIVSEKLLQQNYIDNVVSISLQSDQQTYSVRGAKKGKLFFFIPITLNIQLEVDATTGVVKAIKKSWWSFFVR